MIPITCDLGYTLLSTFLLWPTSYYALSFILLCTPPLFILIYLIGDHNHCESHQTAFLLFYASLFIFYQTLCLTLSHLLSLYITHTKETLLSHWLWIEHRPPTILSIIFLLDIAMLSSINRVVYPVLYLSLNLIYIWA